MADLSMRWREEDVVVRRSIHAKCGSAWHARGSGVPASVASGMQAIACETATLHELLVLLENKLPFTSTTLVASADILLKRQ